MADPYVNAAGEWVWPERVQTAAEYDNPWVPNVVEWVGDGVYDSVTKTTDTIDGVADAVGELATEVPEAVRGAAKGATQGAIVGTVGGTLLGVGFCYVAAVLAGILPPPPGLTTGRRGRR